MSRFYLVIILFNVKFCRVVFIEIDKGIFYWYYIVVGGFVFLLCFVGVMSNLINYGEIEFMVRRNCFL